MIKFAPILPTGGVVKVPDYIKKELRLINGMYFAVHNPNVNRWQIRKWKGIFPKQLSLWRELSENILTICREEYTQDAGLQDVGYMDIDMRTVDAIRESHWWKLRWKQKIEEMDWRNERKERQGAAQFEYEAKYAAKKIWRMNHEPTINQDGKWGYFKGD